MRSILIALMMLFSTSVYAQSVSIDLSKIDSETASKILDAKKISDKKSENAVTPENIEK